MSWNLCKMPECEAYTARPDGDYCESCRRLNAKLSENETKSLQKRAQLLSKPKQVRKRVRPVSEKRTIDMNRYKELRKVFINNHPTCEIKANDQCTNITTDIHHPVGRVGDRYLDVTKWKGACRSCHLYAHDHPKEAIERGWSFSRLATTEPHKI